VEVPEQPAIARRAHAVAAARRFSVDLLLGSVFMLPVLPLVGWVVV